MTQEKKCNLAVITVPADGLGWTEILIPGKMVPLYWNGPQVALWLGGCETTTDDRAAQLISVYLPLTPCNLLENSGSASIDNKKTVYSDKKIDSERIYLVRTFYSWTTISSMPGITLLLAAIYNMISYDNQIKIQ